MGGALVKLLGLRRALWISLGLMVASNLMFALQARAGADPGFLVLTITVENLTGGFGTAAFVAYLSLLCDVRFTATQYALLTSISSVGRTMVGASTGVVAEQWGWEVFFTFTAVAGVPAIIVLWVLARMGSLGLDDEAAAASEGAAR
jgi:PAT family beta-lactamase induction signal transducer AmpG